jgi:hypothetical protein
VLVRFEARQSLVDLARIEREISDELGQSVDLVTENALSPSLRDRVMQDLEVIVGEDSVRLWSSLNVSADRDFDGRALLRISPQGDFTAQQH